MPELPRPYTVLSCAVSLDGYLDDAGENRLLLSGPADLDRVDALRAASDAILVGAATVRNDDPRLLVRDPDRVAARVARGLPPSPAKVTVTGHLKLDPAARFFTAGQAERLVYCPADRAAEARETFGAVADVVPGGPPVTMTRVAADLHARGVRRLLVEGGATVHTQFLAEDLADELHLVVAPFLLGDSRARRWVDDAVFPWHPGRRAHLAGTEILDDVVLLRYALSPRAGTAAQLDASSVTSGDDVVHS